MTKGHNGWDFSAPDGTEVRAAHDGLVTFAGEDGSGGLTVVVRTEEKYPYNNGQTYFKSIYVHLKKRSIAVTAGSRVKTGDLLALADNTGLSTGSHLHFGIKPVMPGEQDWQWYNTESDNGYLGAIDPSPYWSGYFAEDRNRVIKNLATQASVLERVIALLRAQVNKLLNGNGAALPRPYFDETPLERAIIHVESGGNDSAIGDLDLEFSAYGPMQIRWPVVKDVNDHYGTNYRARQCRGNRKLSLEIFRKYVPLYANPKVLGRQPTMEDICRLWNSGPSGLINQPHLNPKVEQQLQFYWEKVKKLMYG